MPLMIQRRGFRNPAGKKNFFTGPGPATRARALPAPRLPQLIYSMPTSLVRGTHLCAFATKKLFHYAVYFRMLLDNVFQSKATTAVSFTKHSLFPCQSFRAERGTSIKGRVTRRKPQTPASRVACRHSSDRCNLSSFESPSFARMTMPPSDPFSSKSTRRTSDDALCSRNYF